MNNNEKNQIKISVIIPVFNAERFINRCIYSILNNTFQNFEIIVIDDGSSDKSFEKIKSIKDARIRCFNQSNHGVGFTRNKGMRIAMGEFIVFIDSDDYIEPDYLEKLFEGVSGSDIGISGINFLDIDEKKISIRNSKDTEWNRFNLPLSGGKIYKREFLIDNQIFFSDFKIGEDLIFSSTCYSKTNNVSNILYSGYNYVENLKSSTHKKHGDLNVIEIISTLKILLEQNSHLKNKFVTYFLRKTLIDLTYYTYDNKKEASNNLIEGYSIIKGNLFLFNKEESVMMNAFIIFTNLMIKFKLGHIPLKFIKIIREN